MEDKRQRLRIVLNDLGTGGTETHLSRVLPVLAKKYDWEIRLFLLSDRLDLAQPFNEAGITIYYPTLPAWLERLCGKKIARFLKTFLGFCRISRDFVVDRKSITHFFLARAYIVGMLAALLTRLPATKYLSRRSLNDYQNRVWGARYIETRLHPKMQAILVNSERITTQLIHQEQVPAHKIIKIYNGLQAIPACYRDRQVYRKTLIQSQGLTDDTWIFITVANLIPYKGHTHLLSALAQLQAADFSHRPWRLLCVGTDAGSGYAAQLRQAAVALGIGDKVSWLGKQANVFALYAGADIGLLCSYQNEGLSNALLEGMGIGLPLIVTDVGGNAEVVVHEKTGLVVPPENPQALAGAIRTLCLNQDLIHAYGSAGRQRVQEIFSLTECVDAYHRVYTGCAIERDTNRDTDPTLVEVVDG